MYSEFDILTYIHIFAPIYDHAPAVYYRTFGEIPIALLRCLRSQSDGNAKPIFVLMQSA